MLAKGRTKGATIAFRIFVSSVRLCSISGIFILCNNCICWIINNVPFF